MSHVAKENVQIVQEGKYVGTAKYSFTNPF